jgi:hypothetical protein
MTIAGKIEVAQRGDSLSVFTGVGWLGWTRNYFWSDFNSAREDIRRRRYNWDSQSMVIVLDGKRRAAFGTMLSEERRYFVLKALRQKLRDSHHPQAVGMTVTRFR